jgi:hypothetical protein
VRHSRNRRIVIAYSSVSDRLQLQGFGGGKTWRLAMRKLSFLACLAVLAATPLGTAIAKDVDLGSQSASDVKKACDGAGGKFVITPGGHEFSCSKKNCDGKGGTCSVTCTGGGNSCLGTTPARIVTSNKLRDILRGSVATTSPPATQSQQQPGTRQPPSGGILGETSGSGFGAQGPAGVGSPVGGGAPAGATPAGRLY